MSGWGFIFGGMISTIIAGFFVSSVWAAMLCGFFGFVGSRFILVGALVQDREERLGATLLGLLCAIITFTIIAISNGWF